MSTTIDAMQQRYLPYSAAARYTGMSEQTLRRLVEDGRLPVYRPTGGRKVVFDRFEIDKLIRGATSK
ncbi:MAG: helix-turn-helix transcriptional regulator [Gemmataceae bacterium]